MAEKPPELAVPRPPESAPLDEMPMARAWLQHLRDSAVFKLEGLDAEQLCWRPSPAANSLGVIVVHLGYAERLWIRAIFAGEAMDMQWRQHMFELPSAGDLRPTTLRWAVFHLIEETARHLGHMDITRELLDGTTGR